MKKIISLLLSASNIQARSETVDWQLNLQCGDLNDAFSTTELAFTDYVTGTASSMDACADWCRSTAESNTRDGGPGKYCCDFLDNRRASDNTFTDSRGEEQTKEYNDCWLSNYGDGMMTDSETHAAYLFKIEEDTVDTNEVQATKVFSFISYSNLGLTTDRDGIDEIVRIELELHENGDDTFEYLLERDVNVNIEADSGKTFKANGFKFDPEDENCFLVLNVYEDDERDGEQKASTFIRCEEIDMAITKL